MSDAPTLSARPTTQVAVGVLVRPDGAVLLADRPAGKPYAGYWEFPGGKLEPGETVEQALVRELHEELGIRCEAVLPWLRFEHDYPHAYVRLHFCRITRWHGQPEPREGQRFVFARPDDTAPEPLLPATVPVMRWLRLPARYALTQAATLGHEAFLRRLERELGRGLRLIQVREPGLARGRLEPLLSAVLARARSAGAQVLLSSRHLDVAPALRHACDGVHLTCGDLMQARRRPEGDWVGASVHGPEQLERAVSLGCDFVVAGPVLPTMSHPGQPGIGWHGFRALSALSSIPVYAIGGLQAGDLETAMHAGAHGVALLSGAWAG
jgi:8-oxo-dGTP diphosphatase